jgi:hypothetical protein
VPCVGSRNDKLSIAKFITTKIETIYSEVFSEIVLVNKYDCSLLFPTHIVLFFIIYQAPFFQGISRDNSSKFLLLIDGVLIDFSFVIFHVQNNVFNIIQVTVYGDHIALFELIREKEQKDVIFTTKFSNHQKTPDSI